MNAPNVPVLMYHHVTPAGGMINAMPDVFEAQIARLARAGYQSLSADQFAGMSPLRWSSVVRALDSCATCSVGMMPLPCAPLRMKSGTLRSPLS